MNGYFRISRSIPFSILVTTPLLLLYNLVYFVPDNNITNGADIISRLIITYSGLQGLVIFNIFMILLSLAISIYLYKHGQLHLRYFFFIIIEGIVYGIISGYLSGLVSTRLTMSTGSMPHGLFLNLLLVAGAGYHEELFFRLILLGGPLILIKKSCKNKTCTIFWSAVVFVGSSMLFSLAHFLGKESFSPYAFWFRTISGMFFATIYLTRGFAVDAYTHFLYDVMVVLTH